MGNVVGDWFGHVSGPNMNGGVGINVVVCFAATADIINNSTNNHRTPPIIPNARKTSQKRKRRPMVASERERKEVFVAKSLKERFRGKTRW